MAWTYADWVKCFTMIEIDETRQRERTRKTRWDGDKEKRKVVTKEDAQIWNGEGNREAIC